VTAPGSHQIPGQEQQWTSLALDELTLTRKEGFAAFAEAPDPPRPARRERDDQRLAGDAEGVGDGEDRLDLG